MRVLAALMGILAPVSAFASSARHEDSSGIFVWVFLGFCALIVVAQVVPALLLMFGMAKGVAAAAKEKMMLATNK